MKLALVAALVLVPLVGSIPTAHACFGPAPTAEAGGFYVIAAADGSSRDVVRANGVGVEISGCWWQGPGARVYQETNGIPGLQTGGTCAPDAELVDVFVARFGQCFL